MPALRRKLFVLGSIAILLALIGAGLTRYTASYANAYVTERFDELEKAGAVDHESAAAIVDVSDPPQQYEVAWYHLLGRGQATAPLRLTSTVTSALLGLFGIVCISLAMKLPKATISDAGNTPRQASGPDAA